MSDESGLRAAAKRQLDLASAGSPEFFRTWSWGGKLAPVASFICTSPTSFTWPFSADARNISLRCGGSAPTHRYFPAAGATAPAYLVSSVPTFDGRRARRRFFDRFVFSADLLLVARTSRQARSLARVDRHTLRAVPPEVLLEARGVANPSRSSICGTFTSAVTPPGGSASSVSGYRNVGLKCTSRPQPAKPIVALVRHASRSPPRPLLRRTFVRLPRFQSSAVTPGNLGTRSATSRTAFPAGEPARRLQGPPNDWRLRQVVALVAGLPTECRTATEYPSAGCWRVSLLRA